MVKELAAHTEITQPTWGFLVLILCWAFKLGSCFIGALILGKFLFNVLRAVTTPLWLGLFLMFFALLIITCIASAPVVYFLKKRGKRIPYLHHWCIEVRECWLNGYPMFKLSTYRFARKSAQSGSSRRSQYSSHRDGSYGSQSNGYQGSSSSYRAESHAAEKSDPWTVLGTSNGAPQDEIKSAYKRLMVQNHPDKLAHLDPSFQKFAQERVITIRRAYEEAMEIKGLRP